MSAEDSVLRRLPRRLFRRVRRAPDGGGRRAAPARQIDRQSLRRAAAVDDLFRYFHTLKAISAMVELGRPRNWPIISNTTFERSAKAKRAHRRRQRCADRGNQAARADHQPHRAISRFRRSTMCSRESRVWSAATRPRRRRPSIAKRSNDAWIRTFVPTRELLASGIGVDLVASACESRHDRRRRAASASRRHDQLPVHALRPRRGRRRGARGFRSRSRRDDAASNPHRDRASTAAGAPMRIRMSCASIWRGSTI